MPRLSCWFIRSALLYLLGGFSLGALLLVQKGFSLAPELWRFLPLHVEWVIFGWILQLVMGVAYWILPRFGAERRRERAVWLAFVLINCGIWLWFTAIISNQFVYFGAGKTAQVLAVICFIWHAWPRVKPFSDLK